MSRQVDDVTSTPVPSATNPPVVAGTPFEAFIEVTYDDHINVRSGPNSYAYDAVGALFPGETASAIGRSPGGWWIQIRYPKAADGIGWVFASNVKLVSAEPLPIVQPPPTPTMQATSTINPTVAAYLVTPTQPVRIPTFTPPGPLQISTFTTPVAATTTASPIPMGLIVAFLVTLSGFAALISFLRRR